MQQATINLPSSHPVRAMSGLAKVLALPAEHTPCRLPSYPALERTAVISFNQPIRQSITAGDDFKIMLARQAAYPAWSSSMGTSSEIGSLEYRADPNNQGTGTMADYEFSPGTFVVRNGAVTPSSADLGQTGFGFDVYPAGYDGILGGLPFAWLPGALDRYAVVHFGMPLASAVTLTIDTETWTGPGEVSVSTTTLSAAVGATYAYYKTAASGSDDTAQWTRPTHVSLFNDGGASAVLPNLVKVYMVAATPTSTVSSTSIVAGTTLVRSLRPIVGPAEFSVSSIPYESTRVTACSLLMTNTTKLLDKNGTVIAGRLNPRTNDPFKAVESTLSSLHPAEKAWLPLETGLYTYCPPSTDLASFWDYVRLDAAGTKVPVYRLDNDSLVNVAVASSIGVGSNLAVTVTTHLEYRTTSALFQLALSGYSLESLHIAQLALASAGFFFENPEHKSVLSKIVNGIKKLEPYVTPAMTVIKSIHPGAGRIADAAYNGGRALVLANSKAPQKLPVKAGPQKVPTTSAKGAGIVVSKGKKVKVKGGKKK